MMGALIRALTNNAVENIEEALGMTDATSSAMKHAIAEWYAAWYGRAPTKTEDPCQRLPYAIVNKLCKATFGEYDSGLQHTDSAKGKYLDCVRNTFDAMEEVLWSLHELWRRNSIRRYTGEICAGQAIGVI